MKMGQPQATTRAAAMSFVLPALLLFGSGLTALIFQVLWIKQLSVVVGVDIHAVTAVVAAFFAGLAIGGLLLGRVADRTARPFLLYAMLEAGVALLGIAATLALARAAPVFVTLETIAAPLAWSMVFLLVGIPACLMGGTLPALVRSLTSTTKTIGWNGGRLYAANTLGAIGGAILSSFLFIPSLGLTGTGFAAATIGLAAALGAFFLDRRAPVALARRAAQTAAPFSNDARLAIGLYAVAGGIALGYEVVWSQSIVQFMSTRAFAFSVVLATYLAGLALGAALYARWADRVRNPWGVFGLLIALAGLVALAEIAFLGDWLIRFQAAADGLALRLTGNELAGMCARFAAAAITIVFLPTLLLGAAFPAALRLAVGEGHVGQGVGTVTALNTLGGIAGTVLTGFVLVPQLGIVRTLGLLAFAAALVGVIAAMRGAGRRPLLGAIAIGVAACVIGLAIPADRLATLLPGARAKELVFYREGRGATVAVVEQGQEGKRFRRLYIQGVSNTGDSLPSLRYMRLQALLPLITGKNDPESVLVVGLGTGITAGATLTIPSLERRVVAELLPGVLDASAVFSGNYHIQNDPRVDIRLRDGRRELLGSEETYDLVTLEPPPPSAAGVANLYSTDFYRLAASRLKPGGMVAQWLPLPTQNAEDTRSLVKSFIDVFPHASLWTTELHEMLLIGSQQPMPLDLATISRRFGEQAVRASLEEVGITSPAALLATWITDREGLARFAADAPPVTDDRPTIEYATWVRRDEFTPVLVELFALRGDVPVIGAGTGFQTELRRERDLLDTFYQAGVYAYIGDRRGWNSQMDKLTAAGGGNAYYDWFSTGQDP
ncbi:fused MFS/spermidine synthase [Mesorhizobium sp. 1B3]|uniref:spermidine synthase n=1 Tax=Mesorhizobium sp. 1B3 TaxID=3243599 RepID=UPI003D954B46